MMLWTIAATVGTVAIWLDLGNRLFGSYARTAWKAAWRITLVTAVCFVFIIPTLAVWSGIEAAVVRIAHPITGIAGIVATLHFFFPLRFGIKPDRSGESHDEVVQLADGIVLRRTSLSFVRLPVEQVRLIVLSDQHANNERTIELLRHAIASLPGGPADIVLLLGDFGERRPLLSQCVEVSTAIPSRLGTYCVLGNHDCEGGRAQLVRDLLTRSGAVLLDDTIIPIRELNLSLFGTNRPWMPAATWPIPEGFTIGLTHTPDNLPAMSARGIDVCVAGHTHGGKLRFPGIGALLVPSRFGRVMTHGWYRHGKGHLFITRGIGYFPGRNAMSGEIVELTLRRDGHAPVGL